MKQKTSQTLFAYWNEVRGGRLAPHRFEIEPSRISQILPEALILERVDYETFRFRLAGTKLWEQFRIEFRGSNFLDLWGEADRMIMERHLTAICRQGAVGLCVIEGATASGRTTRFELILHPLLHTSETVDRLLGALSAIDPPPWLSDEPLVTRRVISHELIWPDGRPHAIAGAMQATQSPFPEHIRRARIVRVDRRQFRVYEGGLSKSKTQDA